MDRIPRVEANIINELQLITVGDLGRFRINLLEDIKRTASGRKVQLEKKVEQDQRALERSLIFRYASCICCVRNGSFLMHIGGVIYYDRKILKRCSIALKRR